LSTFRPFPTTSKPRRAQRGLAALGRNQRMSSHQGTKITKSAAERVSHLCGFVALCESQVFVFQGLAFPPIRNLRKKTRLEQVVVRRFIRHGFASINSDSRGGHGTGGSGRVGSAHRLAWKPRRSRRAQRGLTSFGRNQRMSSHQGTKITKRSAAQRFPTSVALWLRVRTKCLCFKDLHSHRSGICARKQDLNK